MGPESDATIRKELKPLLLQILVKLYQINLISAIGFRMINIFINDRVIGPLGSMTVCNCHRFESSRYFDKIPDSRSLIQAFVNKMGYKEMEEFSEMDGIVYKSVSEAFGAIERLLNLSGLDFSNYSQLNVKELEFFRLFSKAYLIELEELAITQVISYFPDISEKDLQQFDRQGRRERVLARNGTPRILFEFTKSVVMDQTIPRYQNGENMFSSP